MTIAKVNHAYKKHGHAESDKAQKPITFAAYGVVPAIVADFDGLEVLPKNGSQPLRIRFVKNMPNGIQQVIEAVGGKKKQLIFWDMWKKRN